MIQIPKDIWILRTCIGHFLIDIKFIKVASLWDQAKDPNSSLH